MNIHCISILPSLLLLRPVATQTLGKLPLRLGRLGGRNIHSLGCDGSDLILPVLQHEHT